MFKLSKIIWVVLLLLPLACEASVTWKETIQIYEQLIKKNKLTRPNSLTLVMNASVNGWATNENKIYITQGALLYLNKAELASLLAHELSHLQTFDPGYKMKGKFKEDRADFFGMQYAEKIGYSRCKQAGLFKHFYKLYGNRGGENDPHSPNKIRYWRYYRGCK